MRNGVAEGVLRGKGSLRSFGALWNLRSIISRGGVNSRPPDACMYGLCVPGVSLRSTLGY